MAKRDLDHPSLYLNRHLSLLEFNQRVLEQARDTELPLLERLRFLCISSTNLDEFFEIRVAGVREALALGAALPDADQRPATEVLRLISERAHALVADQYRVLNDILIPALAAAGIRFIRRDAWTPAQRHWLRQYFEDELLPILCPLGLDPAHPFPRILNKSLNFIVQLEGKDAFGRNSGMAVVQAPRALPRLIALPAEIAETGIEYVFLSSVIHAFVDELFPGMRIKGCYQFRVTRNSDLYVDEEEVDDLLVAMKGELESRRYGDAVRLEVAANCPQTLTDVLLAEFELQRDDLYSVDGPVNLNRLLAVCDSVDRPDLCFTPFTPGTPIELASSADVFSLLRTRTVLLHHPFESFAPVIDFIRQAARDPDVLAIKQTLYRTGPDSDIVDALIMAARAGKEITTVIEIRARFDEAANMELADRLQEAGAHVVYGVVGHKTHAKMTLVVRREGKHLHNYLHLATGNYHSRTARLYTDYGLLSADQQLGEDAHRIFRQLTSLGQVHNLHKLLQSPFTLHQRLLDIIHEEQRHAEAGREARIIIKLNSLVEPQIVRALYAASTAGVEIDLIIRGMCTLRPGVPGVSERIRVRSVVGRFLEHTRVLHVYNNGAPRVWLTSADWMERNFFRRVEVMFPIEDNDLKERLIRDLQLYLQDDCQAWLMNSDGEYRRATPRDPAALACSQRILLDQLAD